MSAAITTPWYRRRVQRFYRPQCRGNMHVSISGVMARLNIQQPKAELAQAWATCGRSRPRESTISTFIKTRRQEFLGRLIIEVADHHATMFRYKIRFYAYSMSLAALACSPGGLIKGSYVVAGTSHHIMQANRQAIFNGILSVISFFLMPLSFNQRWALQYSTTSMIAV